MSKTFETDTAEMTVMGNKVLDNAEQIATEVEGLISRLEAVSWRGTAADSFHAAKEDWRLQVTTVKQQLVDVAEKLGVSATNYDTVHTASQTGYEQLRGQNLPI
ncbi:MAG: WXG100 family type VII secretion target [Acidimicrobiales bacterium]